MQYMQQKRYLLHSTLNQWCTETKCRPGQWRLFPPLNFQNMVRTFFFAFYFKNILYLCNHISVFCQIFLFFSTLFYFLSLCPSYKKCRPVSLTPSPPPRYATALNVSSYIENNNTISNIINKLSAVARTTAINTIKIIIQNM
jgi:hypothetical protein